jgi:hypothetical protein
LRDSDGDRFLDNAECGLTNPLDATSKPTLLQCAAAIGGTLATDADGDTITDFTEYCFYGTSVAAIDSDGDGCSDAKEIASIDGVKAVNSTDLSQIAQTFGSYPVGAAAEMYDFDINKDGSVGAIDLSQVAQRFGPC